MKVEIFALCDFAQADATGKLNILGVFDRIFGRQAPITHPLCALAIKMRFDKIEEGQKRARLSFIDTDGNSVMPTMEPHIQVVVPPHETTATGQIVVIIQQLKLPNFGEYSIDLAIDGRQEASIPLIACQIPQPPQTQLPPAQSA
jgi:hypothetical protein